MEHKQSKLDTILDIKHNNKVKDQDLIEEAYCCLTRNILKAAEDIIYKTFMGIKRRPPIAWWNKKGERKEKIVRVQYRKHSQIPAKKN